MGETALIHVLIKVTSLIYARSDTNLIINRLNTKTAKSSVTVTVYRHATSTLAVTG